jgi:ketosteroid isomerase-like protein
MSDNDVAQKNLQIVQTLLANGHAGRWDIVRPLVADDVVLHVPKGLPFGGDYRGFEGYKEILGKIGGFFTELKGGPREFATVGNKVIVMSTLSGRIAGNGRPISFPLTDIWELEDGKVREITAFYYDTREISAVAQLSEK